MGVSSGSAQKTAKLRRAKRSTTKRRRLQNKPKPKPRRKNRKTIDRVQRNSVREEATIKRVSKLLGDVSVETLPDFEEDANVFQDLDLMILGSSPEEYMKYTELLRKEYSYLDDANYKKMRLKVSQTASGSKRSTKKQRKILLNSKRRKKVTNTRRKSVLSRMNQKKLREKNIVGDREMSDSENSSTGYESSEVENNSECIIVDTTPSIIVIDDDDEDDNIKKTAAHKAKIKKETDDLIWINSKFSDKTSEFDEPCTSKKSKSPSSQSIKESPEKGLSESIDLRSTAEEDDSLYYRDTTPALLREVAQPDDSVIFVDNLEKTANESIMKKIDDSVVFVSEEIISNDFQTNQEALDYIPLSLNNDEVPGPSQTGESRPSLKRKSTAVIERVIEPFKKLKSQISSLYQSTSTPKTTKSSICLTRSEAKKNQLYNSNVYNPHKEDKKTGKRMVIVDGSNVAFGHSLNTEFSVKGLEICIDYFVRKGHEVKAVVPQFRLQKSKSSNPERLEQMHREGKIVFTPCKNIPGKSSSSYDDRFILQLASEFDAAVVSNDNYRDLVGENPAFKKIVENRVIGYTWCKDMFLLPKDPYGRLGPTLSVILNH